jgi:acetyl-CoA carboxylase biotin carboxyl carrier protein
MPQRQRAKTPPKEVAVTDERLFRITAPLTGVFYSRPRPDAPPFISVGSPIEPGQVVALVEAMKFFNEVRSEVGGVVREIVAKDGQLVRHGDTLIIVERKD